MSKDDEAIQEVFRDAFGKYRGGARKHGEIDIDADPRNFLREMEQELLDAMVYLAFEVVRIRRIERKLNERLRRVAEVDGGLSILPAEGDDRPA